MIGASSMVYFGAFALYYMVTHLKLSLLSNDLVYLLWTALFLISSMLMTGAVSSMASGVFVNYIFSSMNKEMQN